MPIKKCYFLGWTDGKDPVRCETHAEAKKIAGDDGDVFEEHELQLTPEEAASTSCQYLLTCEECNGEYGVHVHWSLHSTVEGAKKFHLKHLDQEDLKGEDASNEWHPYEFDKDVLEFRTGNWGYVSWKIRTLRLLP